MTRSHSNFLLNKLTVSEKNNLKLFIAKSTNNAMHFVLYINKFKYLCDSNGNKTVKHDEIYTCIQYLKCKK